MEEEDVTEHKAVLAEEGTVSYSALVFRIRNLIFSHSFRLVGDSSQILFRMWIRIQENKFCCINSKKIKM